MLIHQWSKPQETDATSNFNALVYEILTREVQLDSPASLFHRILPANETISVKKSQVPEEKAHFHGMGVT